MADRRVSLRMIFLGIGSNLGDKAQHLRSALEELERRGVTICRCSAFYRTAPWGIEAQDDFLNAVCEVQYPHSPEALLDLVLAIETDMGRIRQQKWGPRLIDIDLLEFHRQTLQSERLTLPHPYYPVRDFVLVPLAELEPEWVPTGQQQTLRQLVAQLDAPLPQVVEPWKRSDASPR